MACAESTVSEEIVEVLLDLGADPALKDSHGETPIHLASRYSVAKLKVSLPIF